MSWLVIMCYYYCYYCSSAQCSVAHILCMLLFFYKYIVCIYLLLLLHMYACYWSVKPLSIYSKMVHGRVARNLNWRKADASSHVMSVWAMNLRFANAWKYEQTSDKHTHTHTSHIWCDIFALCHLFCYFSTAILQLLFFSLSLSILCILYFFTLYSLLMSFLLYSIHPCLLTAFYHFHYYLFSEVLRCSLSSLASFGVGIMTISFNERSIRFLLALL